MDEHRPPPGRRTGWYADPRGGTQQRWYDGEEWTVATRPDPATAPADPYEHLERPPSSNYAAIAGLCVGVLSVAWNPYVGVGLLGLVLSLLGRRRATTWVAQGYRPEGRRRATWGLALSLLGTTVTLLLEGFFR
jgi:hypothetical protein